MTIVAALILSTFVAWYIVKPHLTNSVTLTNYEASSGDNSLPEQRERLVQMLYDLELDFATSKLTEHEYTLLKADLSAELGQILKELDGTKQD